MKQLWKKYGLRPVMALFFAVIAVTVTGCHGSKETVSFSVQEEFDTDRQYEITFWAKNDTNKRQTDIYKKAIEDFEALYPNITVDLRLYTDYGKIYNDVITNIATGTTPNVCITYPDHIATYLTGEEVVVPLNELMADKKYGLGGSELLFDAPTAQEMIPQFLDECSFGGTYYAVPFMRSTEACYINKDLVEKLGYTIPDVLTWDFIWEVSEAATKKNSDGTYAVNGQEVLIPFIYKSTDNMLIQMLKQKDAGYSDENGNILLFQDTTKELLFNIADHVKTGAFSTFQISSYPANFLNAGQCIFAVDSTAGSTWMGSNAPLSDISEDAFVDFQTEVRMVPQFDVNHPQMISQGPSICIFNKKDSGEVLASWLFTQYLLSDKVQTAYAETEGYVPVTASARDGEEYQQYLSEEGADNDAHYDVKIKASKLLLENVDNTFVTPVFNGSASLRNAAGQMIENVAKSTRRKETVDDAYLQNLFEDMVSLYHLDDLKQDNSGKKDLGPLPIASKILIVSLIAVWSFILVWNVILLCRKRKQ